MSNIIDFPVQVKVLTCGDCKIFEKCYGKSLEFFGENNTEAIKEESKNIPACEGIKL